MKESNVLDGVLPGQSIRYPAEQKGRFVSLAKEAYLENILGKDVIDLHDETLEDVHR